MGKKKMMKSAMKTAIGVPSLPRLPKKALGIVGALVAANALIVLAAASDATVFGVSARPVAYDALCAAFICLVASALFRIAIALACRKRRSASALFSDTASFVVAVAISSLPCVFACASALQLLGFSDAAQAQPIAAVFATAVASLALRRTVKSVFCFALRLAKAIALRAGAPLPLR